MPTASDADHIRASMQAEGGPLVRRFPRSLQPICLFRRFQYARQRNHTLCSPSDWLMGIVQSQKRANRMPWVDEGWTAVPARRDSPAFEPPYDWSHAPQQSDV
jgi:hypothetical protein